MYFVIEMLTACAQPFYLRMELTMRVECWIRFSM